MTSVQVSIVARCLHNTGEDLVGWLFCTLCTCSVGATLHLTTTWSAAVSNRTKMLCCACVRVRVCTVCACVMASRKSRSGFSPPGDR